MLRRNLIVSLLFIGLLQSCGQQTEQLPAVDQSNMSDLIYPKSVEPEVLEAFDVTSVEKLTYSKFLSSLKEFGESKVSDGSTAFTWCSFDRKASEKMHIGTASVTQFIAGRPATLKFAFNVGDDRLVCMEVFQPKT